MLVFFLTNYLTHVGSVITYPGESPGSSILALISALLLPTAGVLRGLTAIVRRAKFENGPLQAAARSGALCMVVRSAEWVPTQDVEYKDVVLRGAMTAPSRSALGALDIFRSTADMNMMVRRADIDHT